MDIILEKIDDVYMRVICEDGIAFELQDFFSYKAEGYRFHPKFKAKLWNGDIKLFSAYRRVLYKGLMTQLIGFAKRNEYSLSIDPKLSNKTSITPQDVVEFCNSLKLSAHGEAITSRDYQYFSIYHAIHNKNATIIAPTSAGKSLSMYCTLRWFLQNRAKKALIIVPTVSLVSQMESDFVDYSTMDNTWEAKENVHCISAGSDKSSDKRIFISTWQSIYKMSPVWFSQFDMIYCDEVHGAKAKSIKDVMEKTTRCEFKIGTTGTTGSKKVNEMLIEGLFGSIKKVISTKQLMDRDQIAKLSIKCISILYSEIERKECRNKTFQEEVDYLSKHIKRNKLIIESIGDMKGNQLVLVNKIAHIKTLKELADKLLPNKDIFVIYGQTSKERREEIRQLVDKSTNCVIIATYGTMSTGVSIRNINQVIFGSSSKSEIRVLQSLGRGLRKSDTKDSVELYDIIDDLSIKRHKNFCLKHGIERFKIYTKEKFDIEMMKINIW